MTSNLIKLLGYVCSNYPQDVDKIKNLLNNEFGPNPTELEYDGDQNPILNNTYSDIVNNLEEKICLQLIDFKKTIHYDFNNQAFFWLMANKKYFKLAEEYIKFLKKADKNIDFLFNENMATLNFDKEHYFFLKNLMNKLFVNEESEEKLNNYQVFMTKTFLKAIDNNSSFVNDFMENEEILFNKIINKNYFFPRTKTEIKDVLVNKLLLNGYVNLIEKYNLALGDKEIVQFCLKLASNLKKFYGGVNLSNQDKKELIDKVKNQKNTYQYLINKSNNQKTNKIFLKAAMDNFYNHRIKNFFIRDFMETLYSFFNNDDQLILNKDELKLLLIIAENEKKLIANNQLKEYLKNIDYKKVNHDNLLQFKKLTLLNDKLSEIKINEYFLNYKLNKPDNSNNFKI